MTDYNMSNYVVNSNELINNIPKQECRSWCLQEQIIHEFSGIWIIYLSCFCLFLYFVMLHWREEVTKHINHDVYYKILQAINRLSLYLQLGFIIYILFFKM